MIICNGGFERRFRTTLKDVGSTKVFLENVRGNATAYNISRLTYRLILTETHTKIKLEIQVLAKSIIIN